MNTNLSVVNEEHKFELAQRKAIAFSQSDVLPKQFQDNVPNCLILMELAQRMNLPLMEVAQSIYIVYGTPAWTSKFIISRFNKSGKFTTLQYITDGEGDDYGCYATAIEKETNIKFTGTTVTLKMAKQQGWTSRKGSPWVNMSEQMLRYRAATFFIKLYSPEVLEGLGQTKDELEDIQRSNINDINDDIYDKLKEKPIKNITPIVEVLEENDEDIIPPPSYQTVENDNEHVNFDDDIEL